MNTLERPLLVPLIDMLSEANEPTNWLIEGLITEGELIMVHGPSHSGKTYFVLDLALRIAFGMPDFFGFKIPNLRPVIYVPSEGRKGVSRRTGAWLKHHELYPSDPPIADLEELLKTEVLSTSEDLAEHMSLGEDEQAPFYRYDGDLALDPDNPTCTKTLARMVRAVAKEHGQPPLVIVDVVSDFAAAANEDKREFGHALRLLHPESLAADEQDALIPTVILVHHEGHTSNGRPRGSSSIIGLVDSLISVDSRKVGNPLRLTNIRLENPKQRNEDPFQSFVLQLEKPTANLANPVITGRPDPFVEDALLRGWRKQKHANHELQPDGKSGSTFPSVTTKQATYLQALSKAEKVSGQAVLQSEILKQDPSLSAPDASKAKKSLIKVGLVVADETRGRGGARLTDAGITLMEEQADA